MLLGFVFTLHVKSWLFKVKLNSLDSNTVYFKFYLKILHCQCCAEFTNLQVNVFNIFIGIVFYFWPL